MVAPNNGYGARSRPPTAAAKNPTKKKNYKKKLRPTMTSGRPRARARNVYIFRRHRTTDYIRIRVHAYLLITRRYCIFIREKKVVGSLKFLLFFYARYPRRPEPHGVACIRTARVATRRRKDAKPCVRNRLNAWKTNRTNISWSRPTDIRLARLLTDKKTRR